MLKRIQIFSFVLLIFTGMGGSVFAASRIALVIGNSAYKFSPLANPASDAELMTKTLEDTGFKVTKIIDADQKTMKRALLEFGRRLRKSEAVGLFYYAGHGVQVNDKNYLIPIGTNIQDETEVAIEAIDVNNFLGTMERTSKSFNIVILDACRNNPFTRSFRSPVSGLARVSAPRGSFVAYATAPGQVAFDGKSGNSPYTLALTKAISQTNLAIEGVFKQARREVLSATKEKQTPWENSSIIGDFYFKEPAQLMARRPSTASAPDSVGSNIELAYWNAIKDSKNKVLFRSYLQKYPNGSFSPIAVEKVRSLNVN